MIEPPSHKRSVSLTHHTTSYRGTTSEFGSQRRATADFKFKPEISLAHKTERIIEQSPKSQEKE